MGNFLQYCSSPNIATQTTQIPPLLSKLFNRLQSVETVGVVWTEHFSLALPTVAIKTAQVQKQSVS